MAVLLLIFGIVFLGCAAFIFVMTYRYRERGGTALAMIHGGLFLAIGILAVIGFAVRPTTRYAIGAIGALLLSDVTFRRFANRFAKPS